MGAPFPKSLLEGKGATKQVRRKYSLTSKNVLLGAGAHSLRQRRPTTLYKKGLFRKQKKKTRLAIALARYPKKITATQRQGGRNRGEKKRRVAMGKKKARDDINSAYGLDIEGRHTTLPKRTRREEGELFRGPHSQKDKGKITSQGGKALLGKASPPRKPKKRKNSSCRQTKPKREHNPDYLQGELDTTQRKRSTSPARGGKSLNFLREKKEKTLEGHGEREKRAKMSNSTRKKSPQPRRHQKKHPLPLWKRPAQEKGASSAKASKKPVPFRKRRNSTSSSFGRERKKAPRQKEPHYGRRLPQKRHHNLTTSRESGFDPEEYCLLLKRRTQ